MTLESVNNLCTSSFTDKSEKSTKDKWTVDVYVLPHLLHYSNCNNADHDGGCFNIGKLLLYLNSKVRYPGVWNDLGG